VEEDEKEDNVGHELSLKHDAGGLGEVDLNEVQGQVHDLHAQKFLMFQWETVVHLNADPTIVCLDWQPVALLLKSQQQQSMHRVQNYQSCDVVGFVV
jgi:hypothetical protein